MEGLRIRTTIHSTLSAISMDYCCSQSHRLPSGNLVSSSILMKSVRSLTVLALVIVIFGCTLDDAPPPAYDASLATSLLLQADAHIANGDLDAAAQRALQARQLAIEGGHPLVEAKALRLIGLARNEPGAIALAQALSREIGDPEGEILASLAFARIALARNDSHEALYRSDEVLGHLSTFTDRNQRSGIEAHCHSIAAQTLRALNRVDEALARNRRALLALSILEADSFLQLRFDVAMGLGEDYTTLGQPQTAFLHHARASDLARRLERMNDQITAIRALAKDCAKMERQEDAAIQYERALQLAVTLGDADLIELLVDETQAALIAINEGPGSERWERIQIRGEIQR